MQITGSTRKRSDRVVPEDNYEVPVQVRGRRKVEQAELEHVVPTGSTGNRIEEPKDVKNSIEQKLNLITNYSKQVNNLIGKIDREKKEIQSLLRNF
jgi:hypothetical protein